MAIHRHSPGKINMDTVSTVFAQEVHEGLSQHPKRLSSKYFYDEKGDQLFQAIMAMPSYYLTQCEFEIFTQQRDKIYEAIKSDEPIRLVEFGAGDGYKTKVLLRYFVEQGMDFTYHPVDISEHILAELKGKLAQEIPGLAVEPLNMDYFQALDYLNHAGEGKNVVMFLGSNIGNFVGSDATKFLSQMATSCQPGDQLLMGVDLKKDPHLILEAYNDKNGITAQFNLNLLNRMNNELGANFDVTKFKHYESYNPENGEARSYIISMADQDVHITETGETYHFDYAEYIHVEISKKYDLLELEQLAEQAGYTVQQHFKDCKSYFVDTLWVK